MKRSLIAATKAFFRRRGILIDRYNCGTSAEIRLVRMLNANRVDLIIDVGANDGDYGHRLRSAGYAGLMLSFEPLAMAHANLTRGVAGDRRWEVAPRMALGAADGEARINVAANSTSSSLLPMLARHAVSAPDSAYVGHEEVAVRRLDGVTHHLIAGSTSPFLKIDTQGSERGVLEGADALIPALKGIQIELSVVPLYEGADLWLAMHDQLLAHGFELWGVLPGFFDPSTARMLQFDGIYFRT